MFLKSAVELINRKLAQFVLSSLLTSILISLLCGKSYRKILGLWLVLPLFDIKGICLWQIVKRSAAEVLTLNCLFYPALFGRPSFSSWSNERPVTSVYGASSNTKKIFCAG